MRTAASFALAAFAAANAQAQIPAQTPASASAQTATPDSPLPPGAQPVETGTGITSYPPAFFSDANPSNARDMLGRIPGFGFNGGNSGTRGFAGAAGNVLIDGSIVSTKSASLDDALSRIPVDNVVRIDVIRGGAPGIDMQGYSVVANVIRKSGELTSGAYEGSYSVNGLGRSDNFLRAQLSHRTDTLSLDGSAETSGNNMGGNPGTQSRYTAAGALIDRGRYFSNGYDRNYEGAGAAEYRHGLLGIFRASATARSERDNSETVYLATDPTGQQTGQYSPGSWRNKSYELGTDWEGRHGGYTATALGLYRRSFGVSSSRNLATDTEAGSKSPNGETILRATLRDEIAPWLSMQANAEGALNFRDTKSFLVVGGVPQNLPNANVRVEERRADFGAVANVSFMPDLRGEFGMRYETSAIRQRGDTNRQRAFTFGKPRATLIYDVTPRLQMRWRAERRVGQLDFGAFAASNDIVLGTVTAGNANLEPERSWELENAIEYHFWDEGVVSASVNHSIVEEINDRILVVTPTGVYDAPGNIGNGTRDRASFNVTLPLDNLGVPHLRVRSGFSWNWSKLRDPVSGAYRGGSGEGPFSFDWSLNQDMPSWNSNFGISGYIEPRRNNYRLSELRFEKNQPGAGIYWGWQATPGFKVYANVDNLIFKRERVRERLVYSGLRTTAPLTRVEWLSTTEPVRFHINLRKTF